MDIDEQAMMDIDERDLELLLKQLHEEIAAAPREPDTFQFEPDAAKILLSWAESKNGRLVNAAFWMHAIVLADDLPDAIEDIELALYQLQHLIHPSEDTTP